MGLPLGTCGFDGIRLSPIEVDRNWHSREPAPLDGDRRIKGDFSVILRGHHFNTTTGAGIVVLKGVLHRHHETCAQCVSAFQRIDFAVVVIRFIINRNGCIGMNIKAVVEHSVVGLRLHHVDDARNIVHIAVVGFKMESLLAEVGVGRLLEHHSGSVFV